MPRFGLYHGYLATVCCSGYCGWLPVTPHTYHTRFAFAVARAFAGWLPFLPVVFGSVPHWLRSRSALDSAVLPRCHVYRSHAHYLHLADFACRITVSAFGCLVPTHATAFCPGYTCLLDALPGCSFTTPVTTLRFTHLWFYAFWFYGFGYFTVAHTVVGSAAVVRCSSCHGIATFWLVVILLHTQFTHTTPPYWVTAVLRLDSLTLPYAFRLPGSRVTHAFYACALPHRVPAVLAIAACLPHCYSGFATYAGSIPVTLHCLRVVAIAVVPVSACLRLCPPRTTVYAVDFAVTRLRLRLGYV